MLPQISPQQNQETDSRNRFRILVPTTMFLLRDEKEHDFGVDFILEAIGNFENLTNFRSHIQLKSTHKYTENNDKTVSYSGISKSNINYLLNQPNSIYVVYFVKKGVFLWEWVDTIKQYTLEKHIDLNISSPAEFTYRFSKELDENSFRIIHQSIVNLGMNLRDFFDDQFTLNRFRHSLLCGAFYIESNDLMIDYQEQRYEKILMGFKDTKEFNLQEAILIAMCHYNLYRYSEGLLFIETALQKYSESLDLLTIKACLLCESGIDEKSDIKIIMAKDIFTTLLNMEKSYVNYYNLGNAWSALFDNDQAILAYRNSVELKPDFALAWKNLGTAYYCQKNYEQASYCYDNAIQHDSSLPEALFCKGSLLAKFEQYEEALLLYDQVLENKPFVKLWPSILYWKAYILYAQDEFDRALSSINLYILHKPDDLYAMYLKIRIYSGLWRQDQNYVLESIEYLKSVRQFFDDADWILIELFLIYTETEDIEGAKSTFEKIQQNHSISTTIPKLMFEQFYQSQYLPILLQNLDFYLAFRKMSNIQDFIFELLETEVNPHEMFWLPHAIAFCKSMDDSEKMKKFNRQTLSSLFNRIISYVEESHLLLIKYLSRKYYLLDNNKRASIISSCVVYLFDIWIMEASRIFSWICIRHEVPFDVTNKALDLTMVNFEPSRCLEPYLKEFNNVWKWSKEDLEDNTYESS